MNLKSGTQDSLIIKTIKKNLSIYFYSVFKFLWIHVNFSVNYAELKKIIRSIEYFLNINNIFKKIITYILLIYWNIYITFNFLLENIFAVYLSTKIFMLIFYFTFLILHWNLSECSWISYLHKFVTWSSIISIFNE